MLISPQTKMFRLTAGGVSCDREGLFVGLVPLLAGEKSVAGAKVWAVRDQQALNEELSACYGLPIDCAAKRSGLASVATALNRGDVPPNIEAALHSANAAWRNVVQFTTYLVHSQDIPKFMAFRIREFPRLFPDGKYPPNTLLMVDRLRLMSPFSAFMMMGFGALVSSAVLLNRLKPRLKLRTSRPHWKAVSGQHWEYGRWLLASLGLSWIPGNIYYSLVSAFSGMASVGELKALTNFTLPVAQTLTALSICFLPHASRVYQMDGLAALRRLTLKIAWLFTAAAIVYWALLISLGAPILHFLYRGHYTELASLIPWVAAGSIPWNLAIVPTIALRAVRSSVSIFRVYLASSGIALLVGVPATREFGLRGALGAIILSNASAFGVALFLMRRELRTARTATA